MAVVQEIDLEEHFGVELGPEDDHEEHEEKTETKPEPSAGASRDWILQNVEFLFLSEELALLEEHRKKYQVQPQRKVSKKVCQFVCLDV